MPVPGGRDSTSISGARSSARSGSLSSVDAGVRARESARIWSEVGPVGSGVDRSRTRTVRPPLTTFGRPSRRDDGCSAARPGGGHRRRCRRSSPGPRQLPGRRPAAGPYGCAAWTGSNPPGPSRPRSRSRHTGHDRDPVGVADLLVCPAVHAPHCAAVTCSRIHAGTTIPAVMPVLRPLLAGSSTAHGQGVPRGASVNDLTRCGRRATAPDRDRNSGGGGRTDTFVSGSTRVAGTRSPTRPGKLSDANEIRSQSDAVTTPLRCVDDRDHIAQPWTGRHKPSPTSTDRSGRFRNSGSLSEHFVSTVDK